MHPAPTAPLPRPPHRAAFTLIEIVMVLAILGIIVGIALPAAVGTVRKGPMRQAVSDLEEGFLTARMRAILTGQPAELLISAGDSSLEVRAVTEAPADAADAAPVALALAGDDLAADEAPRPERLPSFAAKLHESVAFRTLNINLRDMMDAGQAAVRFYPNGTCDAFSATLFSEAGEERAIALEITTGRARVEVIR